MKSQCLTLTFASSLLLLTEGNAEPEAQFGGRLGFPSIGGPLKLRGTLHLAVPLDACTGKPCPILDLLAFNPEFTTLVSLVKSADLVELLAKPGPITLFAPTNAAFDAIPPPVFAAIAGDKISLQGLLLRHMTSGALISGDLPPGPTPLVTGAGQRVTITAFPHQVTVSSPLAVSSIIDVDNEAANGIVH